MKAFVISLEGDGDAFPGLTAALAGKGANVIAVSLLPGDPPRLGFAVNDEDAARRSLREAHLTAEEYELIELSLANAPGALAVAARELADAGAPIQLLLTLHASSGRTIDMIGVADLSVARLVVRGLSEDGLID